MKSVPLKELKMNLSYWVSQAAKGVVIQITRYGASLARLSPPISSDLHIGSLVGKKSLGPAIRGGTKGASLRFLKEDREEA